MKCIDCNFELPDGAKVCPQCGRPVEIENESISGSGMPSSPGIPVPPPLPPVPGNAGPGMPPPPPVQPIVKVIEEKTTIIEDDKTSVIEEQKTEIVTPANDYAAESEHTVINDIEDHTQLETKTESVSETVNESAPFMPQDEQTSFVSEDPFVPTDDMAGNVPVGGMEQPGTVPLQAPKKKKSKAKVWLWVIGIILLVAGALAAVWFFVPGVQEMILGEKEQKDEKPTEIKVDMDVETALEVDGVSMTIITSYDVGQPPVHTLYLVHNGKSYKTNINDADGSWSYIKEKGQAAMQNALNNAGNIEKFEPKYIEDDAEVIEVIEKDPKAIQADNDEQRDGLMRSLENILAQMINDNDYNKLSINGLQTLRSLSDYYTNPFLKVDGNVMLSDLDFTCTDLEKGTVKMTFRSVTESDYFREIRTGEITFNFIKDGVDYVIDSWTTPEYTSYDSVYIDNSNYYYY